MLSTNRVALVHDYIKEYGGAERVLKVLTEIYPDAPIYTAFSIKNSTAEKEFRGRNIHESWLAPLLKIGKLYSPLRFLTPIIWGSMDLSNYDLVITSCSWYITRGFKIGPNTKVVAYCHTPPRWLYGYETSVGFTKYWPVKVYSAIVGHFMRLYDFTTAQKINNWIANSKNVQERISKFYRKDSVVIYPPVETKRISNMEYGISNENKKEKYFLIVSRLVGAKGLEEAVKVFSKLNKYTLKIVGEAAGYSDVKHRISNMKHSNIELLGRVGDSELYKLYGGATGFVALARGEDFGMTVVEAQAAGCPVLAFNGGGFKESVSDGVTGLLINDMDESTLKVALNKFVKMKWDRKKIQSQAQKFSKERFVNEIKKYVESVKV
jgi:glycosyltransferase involved in cell wall biosynthesis